MNTRLCARVSEVAEENIKKIQKHFEQEAKSIALALADRSNVPQGSEKGIDLCAR